MLFLFNPTLDFCLNRILDLVTITLSVIIACEKKMEFIFVVTHKVIKKSSYAIFIPRVSQFHPLCPSLIFSLPPSLDCRPLFFFNFFFLSSLLLHILRLKMKKNFPPQPQRFSFTLFHPLSLKALPISKFGRESD